MDGPNRPLFAWGYDPIYFKNEGLSASDLDTISKERPIFVLNASEHIAYVNHALLEKAGLATNANVPGAEKGADGRPDGVLREAAAMGPALKLVCPQLVSATLFKEGLYGVADTAHRVGLTTVSELLFGGPSEKMMVEQLKQAANAPDFPVRTVLVYNGTLLSAMEQKAPGTGIAHLNALARQNSNKLRFNGVKFISDGSIQGFTARLKWPGYFNGAQNGLFNMTTDAMKRAALPFWKVGVPIHVHVNGDEAIDAALDVLDHLQNTAPRKTGVFVLEHDQLSTPEQYKRTHDLGGMANIFANHIYYWGDQHEASTLGPDRANRMDNAAEAKRQGVLFSLHTDAPVTPLGPLYAMWAAMDRTTASGRVLGASERISAEDALRAVTYNAASLLGLQNEIGSIEVGKRADFTVLLRNPLTEPVKIVKNIPVVATIQDGKIFRVH